MGGMDAIKVVRSSAAATGPVPAPVSAPAPRDAEALDRLSALLERLRVRAHLFHSGPLCGHTPFEARPGRAFLHVLRRGTLQVAHPPLPGLPARLTLCEPTLLLYPRAVPHVFHNPPVDGSDFTCATLDFDGGEHHPLVVALPPLLCVPLDQVDGLSQSLDLLFAETDRVRCGSRPLADRLFEVVLIQLLRWLLDHAEPMGIRSGLFAGLADSRLARALVALHRCPQDAWPVERMAREAGMSRAGFTAAFKAVTGMTPAEHLSDWRLTLAAQALRNGEPLKRVADAVGYGSAAALSKAFTRRYGRPPRQFAQAAAE